MQEKFEQIAFAVLKGLTVIAFVELVIVVYIVMFWM